MTADSEPATGAAQPVPTTIPVFEVMGHVRALLQHGRFAEAGTLCRIVLNAQPFQEEALFILAQIAWGESRNAEAMACLIRLVTVNPALSEAYAVLGNGERAHGRFERAVTSLRRSLTLNPGYRLARQAMDTLGRVPPAPMPRIPEGACPRQPRGERTFLSAAYLDAARRLIADRGLPHGERILGFLGANQEIFTNTLIGALTHHAFGNIILYLDMPARLYHPNRVSIIFFPGLYHNEYLCRCFENLDIFVFELTPQERLDRRLREELQATTRTLLNLYAAFCEDRELEILSLPQCVRAIPKTLWTIRGDEGAPIIWALPNRSGYVRLVADQVGARPALPAGDLALCRERIQAAYPGFFDRPFVTLLLRRKGQQSSFSDSNRCGGPAENYLPAVRHFTESGYRVVGTGETPHEAFRGIDGYVDLQAAGLPATLLNIFALTQCALFVGQQSGGYSLPNSVGRPCLIVDSFPYFYGSHGHRDLVLNKLFRLHGQLRPLTMIEIYRDHLDLAAGVNFTAKGVDVLNNSAEEILDAAREALTLVERPEDEPEEVLQLAARLRALMPSCIEARGLPSRPPASVLRALRNELMQSPLLPGYYWPRA